MAISSSSQGPITGINITPLVDVCLVLVIIFMVTAPLFMQPSLPVELPKASTAKGKETDNITITITKDGQWAINEKPMTPAEVESALPARVEGSRDRYVIIRADRVTPYAHALEALRMARKAGARDYAIATEQKERKR
ncbi:MAG: biopolymer transporter ExbD [Elusimicrobia bacterium]|nr:biopolymer transporter ExbD [Elusimicrobiota bacterium]